MFKFTYLNFYHALIYFVLFNIILFLLKFIILKLLKSKVIKHFDMESIENCQPFLKFYGAQAKCYPLISFFGLKKWKLSIYAPDVEKMEIEFSKTWDFSCALKFKMNMIGAGVWETSFLGWLDDTYYRYTIEPKLKFQPEKHTKLIVQDPYALACYSYKGPCILKDFNSIKSIHHRYSPGIVQPEKMIIYETHIRDLTKHSSSGVKANIAGRFQGLQISKNILSHLSDLGINVIEFLPVHQFDSNFAGHKNHWGYMSTFFCSIHNEYCSTPEKGPFEFALLIKKLHKKGFKVILDVVYNHTGEGNENGPVINFKGLHNQGYYRLAGENQQYYMNGTGCGNEFRTEHPITRKYIIDSLKLFVDVYKVDGFRFDLAASIDRETIDSIRKALPEKVVLIAEPWTADWSRRQWEKGYLKNKQWSNWNDDYKRGVRGFLKKEGNDFRKYLDDFMTSFGGTCHWNWIGFPGESINYIECHDNDTIADFLSNDIRKLKFAGFCLLTSRGIPMIHQGQEFGKNKKNNSNSYDQDNDINWINWQLKDKNIAIYNYYQNLIKIRKTYEALSSHASLDSENCEWISVDDLHGIGILLKSKRDLLVLFNSNPDPKSYIEFILPQGLWKVLCNEDQADIEGIGTAEKSYSTPYMSGAVLERI